MRIPALALLLALSACATVPPPLSSAERADGWWREVALLSADEMEGRVTGSPGYLRAAAHVVSQLRAAGLEPAGSTGYYQPVAFEEQFVLADRSRAALVADGRETMLSIPNDLVIGTRIGPRPATVDAPLVFIGYGLHIPEAGHDDLAGVDLRGRIAVSISGGPANISGALKSHARAERSRLLAERGAVGAISITTPGQMEAPWSRAAAASASSGLYFADPAMRSIRTPFFDSSLNPAQAELLFAHSGRRFADIAALADASGAVPGLDLRQSLRAEVATRIGRLESPNIVARLPGSDPRLAAEHVVLSAHLDGLGIGAPVDGDRIYNGALDNAAGVGALIDIARDLQRRRVRPRRSILFVIVTGEERGLLGARYFAQRPTVPRASLIANLNYDMALPLFPLRSVIALGAEQSSLGPDAEAVGTALGLPLVPDPAPNRNSFTRSDQYAFIENGIPALAFKFGFAANTPEAEIERQWRATRYHSPSDDPGQNVFREDEIRLHDFIAALALRVANADDRPRWNADSFFRRFARD